MAVADLLSAKGKEDDGTFDLIFNDEAEDLKNIKTIEMPDQDLNVSSWVNVIVSESISLSKSQI